MPSGPVNPLNYRLPKLGKALETPESTRPWCINCRDSLKVVVFFAQPASCTSMDITTPHSLAGICLIMFKYPHLSILFCAKFPKLWLKCSVSKS